MSVLYWSLCSTFYSYKVVLPYLGVVRGSDGENVLERNITAANLSSAKLVNH